MAVEPPRICRAIKRARMDAGWTQVELARKLGVSQAAVGRWETVREPTLEMVVEIGAALGLRRGELLVNAGYVDAVPSVLMALERDRGLTPKSRAMLLASYRAAVKRR